MVGIFHHVHLLKGMHRAALNLILGSALLLERIGDVFNDGHMRPDRIVLKDDADVALLRRDVDALLRVIKAAVAHVDGAGFRLVEAQQRAHERRLAAAAGTDQTHDLAAFHLEGKIFQDAMIAVLDRDVFKSYVCHLVLHADNRSKKKGMRGRLPAHAPSREDYLLKILLKVSR